MNIINFDEKRLVNRIKKGELDFLIDWINIRKDKLYKICWSYVYNHDDIEDIIQNTILRAYENIGSLKESRYFETWFISILINECRQNLRNRKREVLQEDIVLDGVFYDNYDFFQEINSIDDIYKEVVILKYISGYSQQEISEILNIPLGTVKSRIYRGLRDLKSLLKEVE